MNTISSFLRTKININSTNRKFSLVTFTVVFAFIFLNFFEPFGLYNGHTTTEDAVFIELLIALILAFVVLLLSHFVVRLLVKLEDFTVISLFFWFLLEATVVAFVWSIFEVFTTPSPKSNTLIRLWTENILGYLFIMAFPYFLFTSYLYVRDLIKNLKTQSNTRNVSSESPANIKIKDENNTVRLTLKLENLLFIKSADNYVEVHYVENDHPSMSLIRTSIKKLETTFYNTPVIRCHRSFIVNTKKIEMTKKTNAGYQVQLSHFSALSIPVSASYLSEFRKHTQPLNN